MIIPNTWKKEKGSKPATRSNQYHVQGNSAMPRPPSGLSPPPPAAAGPASPRFAGRRRSPARRTTGRGRRPPLPAGQRSGGQQCQGEGPPAPSCAVPGRLRDIVHLSPVNSFKNIWSTLRIPWFCWACWLEPGGLTPLQAIEQYCLIGNHHSN